MDGSNTERLRPHGIVAALLVLALGIAETAFCAVTVNSNTPWRGGDSSSGLLRQQAICGGQRTLVGITGRSGTLLDTVNGAICVSVMPDGKWVDQPSVEAPVANSAAGSAFTLQCPANHAVVGIEGREGMIIDALAIKCGPLSQGADGALVVGAATSTKGPVGGSGGTPFSDSCPAGKLALYLDTQFGSRGDYHHMTHMVRAGCESPREAYYYGLKSMTVSKDVVRPGESATFTFTLDGPAARDQRATVHRGNTIPTEWTASPGWNVRIPGGQRSMSVTVTPGAGVQPGSWIELLPHWSSQPVLSTLTFGNGTKVSVAAAGAPIVQSVTVTPSTLWEGQSATLTTTLAAPAGSSGVGVGITKQCCGGFSGPAAGGINNRMLVQPGSTSASQTVTTASIWQNATTSSPTGTIIAKTDFSGDTGKTFQFTVKANAVKEVSIIRNAKDPANPLVGKVVLEAPGRGTSPASHARIVNVVSSNSSAVQVPATVSISETATSATFPITILDPTIAASTRPGVIISASISGAGSNVVKKVRVGDGASIR